MEFVQWYWNFIKKYISKFDIKIEPSLIIQSQIDTIKNIKAITYEFLEKIQDFKIKLETGK